MDGQYSKEKVIQDGNQKELQLVLHKAFQRDTAENLGNRSCNFLNYNPLKGMYILPSLISAFIHYQKIKAVSLYLVGKKGINSYAIPFT